MKIVTNIRGVVIRESRDHCLAKGPHCSRIPGYVTTTYTFGSFNFNQSLWEFQSLTNYPFSHGKYLS